MANPNALVDSVGGLAPEIGVRAARPAEPTSRFASVDFQGGRVGLLDMADPRSPSRAYVLESVRQTGDPVYVEIDPQTNVITELLIPLAVGVGAIIPTAAGDALEVELIISHARHYLRRTNPDFDQLLSLLEAARNQGTTVLVTERLDDHEIIDVRPGPVPFGSAVGVAPPPASVVPTFAPISLQHARQLFNLVNRQTCCPGTAGAPCIPFQYPDDGCWGRAHEMCRLMIAAGAQPEKVWIYGNLRVGTHNHPSCQVRWGWHVAPTVLVTAGTSSQVYVIDPSMFPGPVPRGTWAGVQGDPSATLVPTNAAVFHRSFSGAVTYDDAAYTQTRQVLDTYRRQLVLRTGTPDGPPPYPPCLTVPPRVQWIGTIGAGATRRWFTHSWPAAWHVVWTIMPLTHCPGAPQLSWTVQVERANATQCTYWITVKNLTSSPVRFEGRYDILSR